MSEGPKPFADRLAALVEERRSQVCLGLDPDPAGLPPEPPAADGPGRGAAEAAGAAVSAHCRELIERAGPACVAAKPQLACFERLGAPGRVALAEVCEAAREAGLLVIADGKRGDVPISSRAYGDALLGHTVTHWGVVEGLGADAITANPLLGGDSLEPLIEAASAVGAGLFVLVRTSNPGASEIQDLDTGGAPLHERLAALVASLAPRLAGTGGLSGMGAVVGATEPRHITRLRELMPRSVFLIPGVGAQGGRTGELGPAFATDRAGALVSASRSIASDPDPGAAAERLREAVWEVSAA